MKTPIKLKTCWEGILNFTTFDKKPRSVARLLNLATTSDISGIRLWKGFDSWPLIMANLADSHYPT